MTVRVAYNFIIAGVGYLWDIFWHAVQLLNAIISLRFTLIFQISINCNFYRDAVICVGFCSQSCEIEVIISFYTFGRVGVGVGCELFLLVYDLYIRYTELFALRFFFICVYPAAYVPKTF